MLGDIAVIHLRPPKVVRYFAVLCHDGLFCLRLVRGDDDLGPVFHGAFATQRVERADVRVHRREKLSRVLGTLLDVLGPIEPIEPKRIHWPRWIIVLVQKFHDPTNVVRLTGWLTNEINMV